MSISTVHSLAKLLFRDLGITSLSEQANLDAAISRPVTSADKLSVLTAIHGAYEEIFKDGPAYISEDDTGSAIRPQATVTLNVTQYSTTIANLTTYASWMIGCTIRIAGDEQDNEIKTQTSLARPYMGSTATGVSATVYCDAIPLPSNVRMVMEPIRIMGLHNLTLVKTKGEFLQTFEINNIGTGSGTDYGRTGIPYVDFKKSTADPLFAFCDTRYVSTSAGLQKFLRLNSLPTSAATLSYRVKLAAPSFTVDDIGEDWDSDPGTVLPLDDLSSVIYAIARKRISGDPLFGANNAIAEITRQYIHAQAQLASMSVSSAPSTGIFH